MKRDTNFPALLTREEAARRCKVERVMSGTIVFTNGVFDILHRGHIEYLCAARDLGTVLIVGVNSDDSTRRLKGPKRPLMSAEDRVYALAALRCVDHVVLFDEDTPEDLIKAITPDVLVKGGDYKPSEVAGAKHVEQNGGKVVILPFRDGCSTSGLIEEIVERFS
ncbi:MAG TPA: D-glycero-beta-D-manno-heptose 1-phosphate adenylyltransferase [bacterium]|jgi:D-beta-D-heptose 7-phosphate kinase/D-beta-D-heptose 1-phosphate adenosyltransferase